MVEKGGGKSAKPKRGNDQKRARGADINQKGVRKRRSLLLGTVTRFFKGDLNFARKKKEGTRVVQNGKESPERPQPVLKTQVGQRFVYRKKGPIGNFLKRRDRRISQHDRRKT